MSDWNPPKPCEICGCKYLWSTSIKSDRCGNDIDYYFQCFKCMPPRPGVGHKVFMVGDTNHIFKLTTSNINYRQETFPIIQ